MNNTVAIHTRVEHLGLQCEQALHAEHAALHQPLPDFITASLYAIQAGSAASEALAICSDGMQRPATDLSSQAAIARLRAALKALDDFREGDLTAGEFNALVKRAHASAQTFGAPTWARAQDILIEDVLKAAAAAEFLA